MRIETRGEVAVLRMEAGTANAMNAAFLDRLDELLGELEASEARAGVVTGHGRFFSAGLALPELVDLDRAAIRRFMGRFSDVMVRALSLEKPLVAAVGGHAIAGGCVLALQADVRVMAEDAGSIGINEVALGIGLPASALEPLRAQVAPAAARRLACEGELVGPAEARDLGLVDEVVPGAELEPRALERARRLASLPRPGYAQVKRSLRAPIVEAIRSRTGEDTEAWLDTWFSGAARERVRAVVDKLRRD